jgi:AcrR family transcriptional regulator
MDRQAQFRAREVLIFDVAERLLLESGETGMTLDALALELDLAKGTLYKHFQSKDELYLHLIIRNEQTLLNMMDTQADYPSRVALFMLHHLHDSGRTVLLHQIEERLSAGSHGLGTLFAQLYRIRKQRLRRIISLTTAYLQDSASTMPTRDYLAAIWSTTQGGAAILNSSFYQRYLGDRDTLRVALIEQVLAIPFAHSPHQYVLPVSSDPEQPA